MKKRIVRVVTLLAALLLCGPVFAAAPAAKNARHLRIYRQLAHATYIQEGHGPRVLYDFFDPDCPYCHALYEHLRTLIPRYGVTLREVPIAYLRSTSEGKAAAILQSSDPLHAFQRAMAGFRFHHGASIGQVIPTRKTTAELHANLALDHKIAGFSLVPVLVYQKTDGAIRFIDTGAPPVWVLKQMLSGIAR